MHVNIPEANYVQTLCQGQTSPMHVTDFLPSNLLNDKICSLHHINKVVFIDSTPESAVLISGATGMVSSTFLIKAEPKCKLSIFSYRLSYTVLVAVLIPQLRRS